LDICQALTDHSGILTSPVISILVFVQLAHHDLVLFTVITFEQLPHSLQAVVVLVENDEILEIPSVQHLHVHPGQHPLVRVETDGRTLGAPHPSRIQQRYVLVVADRLHHLGVVLGRRPQDSDDTIGDEATRRHHGLERVVAWYILHQPFQVPLVAGSFGVDGVDRQLERFFFHFGLDVEYGPSN
jgi:hypothetical protein